MRTIFGISKSSFSNRRRAGNTGTTKLGRPTILTPEEEALLVRVIIGRQGSRMSMTKAELQNLMAQVAQGRSRTPVNRFLAESFLKRHPEISIFSSTGMSRARHYAVNPVAVGAFFDMVETELADVPPSRLFIMDETGIETPKSVFVS